MAWAAIAARLAPMVLQAVGSGGGSAAGAGSATALEGVAGATKSGLSLPPKAAGESPGLEMSSMSPAEASRAFASGRKRRAERAAQEQADRDRAEKNRQEDEARSAELSNMSLHESVLARGKEKGGAIGKLSEGTETFLGGMQAQTQGGLGGTAGMMRGVGGMTEAIPGIGQVTGPIFKFGAQLTESVEKLRVWSNQMHQANMQFAEFSAGMSAVQARQEVFDIRQSQIRGDRLAGSAEFLAQGKRGLETETSKIEDFGSKLTNYIGGGISLGVSKLSDKLGVGDFFTKAGSALDDWAKKLNEEQMAGNDELTRWYTAEQTEARRGARDEMWVVTNERPERFRP